MLLISVQTYAKCTPNLNPVTFSLGGNNLIINKMLNSSHRQIPKDAQPYPDRYDTVFNSCANIIGQKTNSFFIMEADSSLNPNDSATFSTLSGPRKFLAINANEISIPAGATAPKVYISFAVYDPRPENAGPTAVITELNREYPILKGDGVRTKTIGLVLDKVYLYIIPDQNSIPGEYKISNIRIGHFFTRSYDILGNVIHSSESKKVPVNISPALTFQIKNSTCALDQKNYMVKLDPVLVGEFKGIHQATKVQNQNIILKCPDESQGIGFNATLTDNHPQAEANDFGLLKNQIPTDQGGANVSIVLLNNNNTALPISTGENQKVFSFGALNSSKQVIFPLKIGYQATTLPIRPGQVKAVANINVDYN
ncbi:hypothetical protein BFG52_00700 [Acinetobacter larvae]|uniref:Fimbrial-type adhesion domain-containing protein n=2 Tax=Acinetobacter larvae TaxID=1789224 RepID=A0A1B2LVS1_9GAMM|nr:hypothetical protein BFG52_00700 [Acinetobacter larvae]